MYNGGKINDSSILSFIFPHMKAKQAGLWMIWLFGLFLIGISFYATQLLSSSLKDSERDIHGFGSSDGPTITLFTAPAPFTSSIGQRQSLAVRSWLALSGDITVVLFSQDPSVFSFAAQFGSKVLIEPNIDFSFLNTPFFHSMVARSQASTSDISVLVDPEIILFEDFISTLNFAHKLDHDWLLFASSQNVSHFPFHLDANRKDWLADGGTKFRNQKFQGLFADNWQKGNCDLKMLMAWNKGELPLHSGVLPPFLYGKGLHYQWLITEALSSDFRLVIGASRTISSFHLHSFCTGSHSKIKNRIWEFAGNSRLASLYGSFSLHMANYSNLFTLIKCGESYLFLNAEQNFVYEAGYDIFFSLRKKITSYTLREKKVLDCVNFIKLRDEIKACSVKDESKLSASLSLPFSLEFLLSMRANHNGTIVLAVAGYSYKDMLMSWICRLHHLHVSNFVVCALDDEIYDYSLLQGLPVFRDPSAPTNISFDNCHFGTVCFQRVTKVKSRVVLQILKLGYNVLLSDVDVYWFKNPLRLMNSFGPAVIVAQSDEYKISGPINLPRRLNSGFYYVNSDGSTIAALQKVVKHAAHSNLSEQPSFYDTLCGEGGSNRIGINRCFEPETSVTVHFLDRDLFPNGAYKDLWEEKNVTAACMKQGCFVLHNNWISGRIKKLDRQVLSGLWEYDMSTRMCLRSWQKTSSTTYF